MGKTPHFQIDFLEPYQFTNQDVNMDQRRFTTIDNNMYALFQIFGNGIIVTDPTQFPLYVETQQGSAATQYIVVSAGQAFVNNLSINYQSSTQISLPSQNNASTPQTYYLYLKSNSTTASTQTGNFIFSSTQFTTSNNYIGLGAVVVDYVNGVTTFYDTSAYGRQIISVKKLYLSFINNHYHTGGLGSPKKIDLQNETTGYISDTNIINIDASKIRGGQLSKYVTPQFDHNYVLNSGNLSHSQIDSGLLSFRDHLNLEIVSAVNNNKVIANIIRTTSESWNPPAFPTGSVATIDKGCNNIFVYVPGVTTDFIAVGITGPTTITGSITYNQYISYTTGATGPGYAITPISGQANIDRINNLVVLENPIITGSSQKTLILQPFVPSQRMNSRGVYGYFYGFVPGITKNTSVGDAHLIHYQLGNTGPTGAPIEAFSQYKLTNPERFNSMNTIGDYGVQAGCILTCLTDFYPQFVYNYNNYNYFLLSSGSTGPRSIYSYQNGYFDSLVPQPLFNNIPFTGPFTGATAFYCESYSGPYATLFANQQCFVNLNGTEYSFYAGLGGRFTKYNGIVSLVSFVSSSIYIYEIGASSIVNTVYVNSGQSITKAATSFYSSPSNYKVYYIDTGRLYVATQSGSTELGYFGTVTDIQIKYGVVYILVNNAGSSSYLYYAYDSGFPTTFNQIVLNTNTPSMATMDIFQQTTLDPIYIGTVSSGKYQVFNITGQQVYQYQQNNTGSSGPTVSAMFYSFDLGDATIDMKYPFALGGTGSLGPSGTVIFP